MNWTGGRRARASKVTNGPLHRQRQYFARMRAAQTTNAYSAASSSPNPNHYDGSPARKRNKTVPQFDILQDQQPKKSSASLPAPAEVASKNHDLPSEIIKSRTRRLLQMEDWVGAKHLDEETQRERDLEEQDQALMDSALEKRTPIAPSEVYPQQDIEHGRVSHPPISTQALTVITDASRNYGNSGLKLLPQGGYMRIGKTTFPPRPKQPSEASIPAQGIISRQSDDISQDSMLLDYEELVPEASPSVSSSEEAPREQDQTDKDGNQDNPEDGPANQNEVVHVASPSALELITTSSVGTVGDSEVFAFVQNPSRAQSRVTSTIRHRDIEYEEDWTPPLSPTKSRHGPSKDKNEPWPTFFPTQTDEDSEDEVMRASGKQHNANRASEMVNSEVEATGESLQAHRKANMDEEVAWRRFIPPSSEDVDGEEEDEALSERHQPLSTTSSVINHIISTSAQLPPLSSPPITLHQHPLRSSPPLVGPLATSSSCKTSPQLQPVATAVVEDADASWFMFTNPLSAPASTDLTAPASLVPVEPTAIFTEAENKAWRAFVFASSQASDIEEELLREEQRNETTTGSKINAESDVSAVSVVAMVGSTTGGESSSDINACNASSETGKLGCPTASTVQMAENDVGSENDLASIVAVAGDTASNTDNMRRRATRDQSGRQVTWRPPKKFTGGVLGDNMEQDVVEDIEEW